VLRGVLEGGVGLSVVLSSAPALAATSGMTATAQVSAVPSADNQPLSLPSLDRRPTTELQLAPLSAVPAPVLATAGAGPVVRGQLPEDPAEVVVRRGDCLWSVVARALGPDADDAAVARAWPRWYAANRAVIGDDPALLLPGQRLVAPDQTS
jgi:nucleoid-associated protein YgaU